MAARGVKTKVTDNDGSDFAFRQTIEDRYQLMAQLKQQLRHVQSASRSYFVLALCIVTTQWILHSTNSPFLRYHPLLLNMSPLPLLCILIVASIFIHLSFSSMQHSTSSQSPLLLYVASLLEVFLAVITIILPLTQKASLTTVDWLVVGIHTLGLSVVTFGLYNGFKLSRVSKTKRI